MKNFAMSSITGIFMSMKNISICFFVLSCITQSVLCTDALQNHRAEKRQDDSFLLFGGWRPVRPGTSYRLDTASTGYHNLLTALPSNYNSGRYYGQALPSTNQYRKDIYNFYPRPVIKSFPKKNTPIYTETFTPQNQNYNNNNNFGGVSIADTQFINLEGLNLDHIKELHEALQHIKDLPIAPIELPEHNGKQVELVEVSLPSLQKHSNPQNYARNSQSNNGKGSRYNGHRNGNRNGGRGNKNGNHLGKMQDSYRASNGGKSVNGRGTNKGRHQVQQPMQIEYFSIPNSNHQILHSGAQKEIEVGPINIPIPSISDILNLKNVQIIEVPIPSSGPLNIGQDARYSQGPNANNKVQYNNQPQKHAKQQQKHSLQQPINSFSYYAQQFESSKKQQTLPTLEQNNYHHHQQQQQQQEQRHQQQQQVEAELIKLSDEDLKGLLDNLQILHKNPEELLKYLPLSEGQIGDKMQVFFPEFGQKLFSSNQVGYERQNHQVRNTISSEKQQEYAHNSYQHSQESASNHPSNGYSSQVFNPYQIVEYDTSNYGVLHDTKPDSTGTRYKNAKYENPDIQSTYEEQKANEKSNQQYEGNVYPTNVEQNNEQNSYKTSNSVPAEQERRSYIEVVTSLTDGNGYHREPVLAVELKHGQTIEDAINSLDTETLNKIGAHGKDGIEVEIVEVPVDEYIAESKATASFVSSQNSTITAQTNKTMETKPDSKPGITETKVEKKI